MNSVFKYFLNLSVAVLMLGCQQRMTCPAFHSSFILDTDVTRTTFSLFGPDSLPKQKWDVDKEKYGIAKEISDEKKTNELQTISMNSIYKKLDDPMEMFRREYAESDSIPVLKTPDMMARRGEEISNIDQMIYLYHFGKYLPNRGARQADLKEDLNTDQPLIDEDDIDDESTKKAKKKPKRVKQKKQLEIEDDLEEDDDYEF